MTIPNIITIFRFLLTPLVVYALLEGAYPLAFAGFVLAGLSDGVDGFIARRFDQRSRLGAYLDPAADKLLLVSVFVVLGMLGVLPLWLVILVVSRDVLIVAAVLLASVMGSPVEMKPLTVSKVNTAAQIVLAATVLAKLALGFHSATLVSALAGITGLLTIASAAAYLVAWLRHMNAHGEN